MSEVNIFEVAAKKKLRFETHVGAITVEQLYDLPLVHKSPMCLDAVAQSISMELKMIGKHSFVEVKPDPRRGDLEVKLEIVKHVIADKLAAKEAAEKRVLKAQKRKQLLDALSSKEAEEIYGKSKEELEKDLAELDED